MEQIDRQRVAQALDAPKQEHIYYFLTSLLREHKKRSYEKLNQATAKKNIRKKRE